MIARIFNTGLAKPGKVVDLDIEILDLPTIEINFQLPEKSLAQHPFWDQNPLLVFLSKNGVLGFRNWLSGNKLFLPIEDAEIWAVGESTAELIRTLLHVEVRVPEVHSARGLINNFQSKAIRPVILISGQRTRPELSQWLLRSGWNLLQMVVYQTKAIVNSDLPGEFTDQYSDVVFFTSPSTVDGFLISTNKADLSGVNARLATIGPTTSDYVRELKGTVYFESPVAQFSAALTRLAKTLLPTSEKINRNN